MNLFEQRRAFESELVQKALKDDAFRRALTHDPKAALENEWGVSLPDRLQVHVHQETRHDLHVVLPAAAEAARPLDSSEMQPVADFSWGHAAGCALECTQCSNNDTTCQPGPTEE